MGSILPPNDFSAIPFCSHEQGHTRLDRISNTEHDWMNRGSQIDSWSHREQTAFAKNDSQRKDAVDNSCFDLMKYAGTTRLSTCHMGRSLTCAGRTSAFIQFALVGYSLTSNYFCPNKEPQKWWMLFLWSPRYKNLESAGWRCLWQVTPPTIFCILPSSAQNGVFYFNFFKQDTISSD